MTTAEDGNEPAKGLSQNIRGSGREVAMGIGLANPRRAVAGDRAIAPRAPTGPKRWPPHASMTGLVADRYDHDEYRREAWARGVKPMIARRQTEHSPGLGRERWASSRLRTRYEPRSHLAFLELGCAVIRQRVLSCPDQGSSVSRPY
jgi:hypothetical protein